MQAVPFDRGAMRECYRLLCTEPLEGTGATALKWRDMPLSVAKKYMPVRPEALDADSTGGVAISKATIRRSKASTAGGFEVGDLVRLRNILQGQLWVVGGEKVRGS